MFCSRLGKGNFVTVADLSIKDTDEDEMQAQKELSEKNVRRQTKAAAPPPSDGALRPTHDLLGQFLASSKEIYRHQHPSTSKDEQPLLFSKKPSGPVDPSQPKTSQIDGGALGKMDNWGKNVSKGASVQSDAGMKSNIDSMLAVRGSKIGRDSTFTNADLRDARTLELGHHVRQLYNSENYAERFDKKKRHLASAETDSSRRSPSTTSNSEIIYTRANVAAEVTGDSESCQHEDYCAGSAVTVSQRPSSTMEKDEEDISRNTTTRKRRRKKREIRKRCVKQLLIRGENVVLVACKELPNEAETSDQQQTSS